jgi:hypothetical protein
MHIWLITNTRDTSTVYMVDSQPYTEILFKRSVEITYKSIKGASFEYEFKPNFMKATITLPPVDKDEEPWQDCYVGNRKHVMEIADHL